MVLSLLIYIPYIIFHVLLFYLCMNYLERGCDTCGLAPATNMVKVSANCKDHSSIH